MALAVGLLVVLSPRAFAVTTRTWVTTSYADFDAGHGKGALISSHGEVRTGHDAERRELAAGLAFATVTASDGTVYVGTGSPGEVWVAPADAKLAPHRLAHLDGALLVPALALAPDGTLYAGTVPGGRIVTVDRKSGAVKPFVKLDGAEHVWALSYDGARRTLYAATGPEGKLFAIDATGHARVVFTSEQKQLLALVHGEDGALYVGTAPHAILFRVDPTTGQARALHDFDGDELRALARGADGSLYVAVNQFEKSKGTVPGPAADRELGTKMSEPPAGKPGGPSSATEPPLPRPGTAKGKGAIFAIGPEGRVEQLHGLADGFFTALAVDGDGTVWAGAGSSGKAYEILPDRTVLTALDLPERQILSITPLPGGAHLVATGDAAALYDVTAKPPADASYTSKAFDAKFLSRFGTLDVHGDGALAIETRSGNTATPDPSWSGWQAPIAPGGRMGGSGSAGKIASPPGQYLQYRVRFGQGGGVLREVTAYYLPQNQRPHVSDLQVGDPDSSRDGGPCSTAEDPKPSSTIAKITWKASDPDGDDTVFRLFYRQEGELDWRPLAGKERPLTEAKYDWETAAVPDGRYEIRLVASDETSNPPALALEDELVSAPVLVDNAKPEIADLKVAYPTVVGRARDAGSRIAEVSYAIDGGDFHLAFPKDGLFDDPVEEFEIRLAATLTHSVHTLVVRAEDEAGNLTAIQRSFRVP